MAGRVRRGSGLGSDSWAECPVPGWAAGLLAGLRLGVGATYWPEAPLPEPGRARGPGLEGELPCNTEAF